MNPANLNSKGNALDLPQENGYTNFLLLADPEKAVKEIVEQPLVEGIEDHLVEFSEAMRTVSKVLRQAAEGKASAQAEATEWKRKYEMERERSLQLEHKVLPSADHKGNCNEQKVGNPVPETAEKSQRCCGENGICSHEVLRDREKDSYSNVQTKLTRKASFKLKWCSKGKKDDQHKHDIVSFEKGNITTAERSSKQISLKWESPPQTVLILTKPNSTSVTILCAEMVRWLKEKRKLNIYVEPRVRTELLSDSSYYNFVQTWKDGMEITCPYYDT